MQEKERRQIGFPMARTLLHHEEFGELPETLNSLQTFHLLVPCLQSLCQLQPQVPLLVIRHLFLPLNLLQLMYQVKPCNPRNDDDDCPLIPDNAYTLTIKSPQSIGECPMLSDQAVPSITKYLHSSNLIGDPKSSDLQPKSMHASTILHCSQAPPGNYICKAKTK